MKLNVQTMAWFLLGGCLAGISPLQAQKQIGLKKGPNISLNITNPHKDPKRTYLNIGLLSHFPQLNGVGINVISSTVQGNANGFQLSGITNISGLNASGVIISSIANVSGKNLNGVALSGLMNIGGKRVNGIQLSALGNVGGTSLNGVSVSGLINLSGKNAAGFHLAGLANINRNNYQGITIGGLMNACGEDSKGVQVTSLLNVAGKSSKGVQLAGLGNVSVTNQGLQLACANYSEKNKGLQLGVANFSNEGKKGLQIGIVNISADSTAHQWGVINLKPKTRTQLLISGGNANKANLSVRFKNKYTYTQLGAGAYYLDTNKDFSFSGFYRAGLYISLTSRLTLNGDVGYYHIETLDNKHAGIPARMYAIEPRISLEYQVLKRLGIFAAGGYNWTRTYQGNKFENKGVFEAGLVLF